VQAKIYDEVSGLGKEDGIIDTRQKKQFLKKFTEKIKSMKVGDPFAQNTDQGPQVSKIQFDVRRR
jgi:acyl-CoA reductase-like NAD-dependent aldehyde dehydrogenase